MSDTNEQLKRKDRVNPVKPETIEHKAQQEQPGEMIDPDKSATRGRRPLFRS